MQVLNKNSLFLYFYFKITFNCYNSKTARLIRPKFTGYVQGYVYA